MLLLSSFCLKLGFYTKFEYLFSKVNSRLVRNTSPGMWHRTMPVEKLMFSPYFRHEGGLNSMKRANNEKLRWHFKCLDWISFLSTILHFQRIPWHNNYTNSIWCTMLDAKNDKFVFSKKWVILLSYIFKRAKPFRRKKKKYFLHDFRIKVHTVAVSLYHQG